MSKIQREMSTLKAQEVIRADHFRRSVKYIWIFCDGGF